MKKVLWVASSKKDLKGLPLEVIKSFGYALHQAQMGDFPDIAKPFKGFGSAEVLELTERDEGSNTYRALYTVKFEDAIVVLHVFQKKSKTGKETTKQDVDLIHARFKRAEQVYNEWKLKEK